MRHISKLLTAAGLTTVHDAGVVGDTIRAYEDVRARRRAAAPCLHDDPRRARFHKLRDAGVYTGFGDEWIRVGGVKFARRRLGVGAHDAHEHAVRRHDTTTAS